MSLPTSIVKSMAEPSYDVFRYLSATDHADDYRAIMRQFAAYKARFIVHLRPEEVRDAVRPGVDLSALLDQLVSWGNLKADPDTSRVATVEEFNRARYIYQFTSAGESAERVLGEFDRAFGATAALQSFALEDIVEQLHVILGELDHAEPDEAKTALALTALTERFTALAANAQAFSGDLQRTIELRDISTEAFIAYKEQLIGYLQRFIQDLVARTSEIAGLLERITADDQDRLLRAAAAREARDAAPGMGDAATAAFEFTLRSWQERFSGFRQWFAGSADAPSQSQQLRHMALNAIPALLSVVQRLGERRAGRSDRAADFRTLALWFAQAPGDDDRHRLAAVAFGLGSARHLAINAQTLEARQRTPVAATVSWEHSPPVEISPRLRATGSYERRGSSPRVRDRAAERRAIAQAVEDRRLDAQRVARQLLVDEPVPVGDYPLTDPQARDILLQLLTDALGQRQRPADAVTARSLDGNYLVEVQPVTAGRTTVALCDGTLTGPAHRIRIRLAHEVDPGDPHRIPHDRATTVSPSEDPWQAEDPQLANNPQPDGVDNPARGTRSEARR